MQLNEPCGLVRDLTLLCVHAAGHLPAPCSRLCPHMHMHMPACSPSSCPTPFLHPPHPRRRSPRALCLSSRWRCWSCSRPRREDNRVEGGGGDAGLEEAEEEEIPDGAGTAAWCAPDLCACALWGRTPPHSPVPLDAAWGVPLPPRVRTRVYLYPDLCELATWHTRIVMCM